jgi:hypothetical protein
VKAFQKKQKGKETGIFTPGRTRGIGCRSENHNANKSAGRSWKIR